MAALPSGKPASTSIEGALLELALLLQEAEQADTTDPENRVQVEIDTDAMTASISSVMPLDASFSTSGALQFAAVPYTP